LGHIIDMTSNCSDMFVA